VEHGCATAIEPMYMSGHVEDGILHMEVIEKTVDSTQSIEKALDDSLRIPALENERGRGLFLIRVYVDSLDVDMNDKGKLRIRLQKRIRS
jgi:anti-sigma regulatory factor (Ser/Thr protein kinase)